MKNLRRALAGAWFGLVAALTPAAAQTNLPASGGAPVLCGFAKLAVTGSTGNVALPAVGAGCTALTVYNDGAQEAFWNVGATVAVTATTSSTPIPAGKSIVVYINPALIKYGAAITSTSTTTLLFMLGSGPVPYL